LSFILKALRKLEKESPGPSNGIDRLSDSNSKQSDPFASKNPSLSNNIKDIKSPYKHTKQRWSIIRYASVLFTAVIIAVAGWMILQQKPPFRKKIPPETVALESDSRTAPGKSVSEQTTSTETAHPASVMKSADPVRKSPLLKASRLKGAEKQKSKTDENASTADQNNDYRLTTEDHYNLGVSYGKIGGYDEALEAFGEVIRIDPDHAAAHYAMGYCYSRLGLQKNAARAYRKSIRLEPDSVDARYNLGIIRLKAGDRDGVIEQYEALKDLDKDSAKQLLDAVRAHPTLDIEGGDN
jgi:tetratricopeptide (TPR) repeat protein|tara:strand:- start:10634 stop:11521 length:888 start_codon:yes stop_codon:yes gene_type:complete